MNTATTKLTLAERIAAIVSTAQARDGTPAGALREFCDCQMAEGFTLAEACERATNAERVFHIDDDESWNLRDGLEVLAEDAVEAAEKGYTPYFALEIFEQNARDKAGQDLQDEREIAQARERQDNNFEALNTAEQELIAVQAEIEQMGRVLFRNAQAEHAANAAGAQDMLTYDDEEVLELVQTARERLGVAIEKLEKLDARIHELTA